MIVILIMILIREGATIMDSFSKTEIDKFFGKIIKEYRIKSELTQEELAEELGISIKYVSRLENGYSGIKRQTLINCMNLLGISPNVIFSEFITNKDVINKIEISNKLEKLSPKQINFVNGIIELIENYEEKI